MYTIGAVGVDRDGWGEEGGGGLTLKSTKICTDVYRHISKVICDEVVEAVRCC